MHLFRGCELFDFYDGLKLCQSLEMKTFRFSDNEKDSRVDLTLNDVQIKILKTLSDTNRRSTHATHHAGVENFKTSSPLLCIEHFNSDQLFLLHVNALKRARESEGEEG